jgi:hypothetical protein
MFGLPPCARHGCPLPGIFKVEVVDSTGQVTAYVCPLCLTQVPVLLQEMTEVREERKLLVHEDPEDEHGD